MKGNNFPTVDVEKTDKDKNAKRLLAVLSGVKDIKENAKGGEKS